MHSGPNRLGYKSLKITSLTFGDHDSWMNDLCSFLVYTNKRPVTARQLLISKMLRTAQTG